MPWGWECRKKLIKQFPAKPTVSRRPPVASLGVPGPQQYESPQIFCGNAFGDIKRAPAYTFGHRTPLPASKPSLTPKAPVLNISGGTRKGTPKIKNGLMSPRLEPPAIKSKTPGPANYTPFHQVQYKHAPAYSIQPAARAPYQPTDQWTPSPNMYWPAIPARKPPAYTIGYVGRSLKSQETPAPGTHDPNFDYIKRKKPAFSFGAPYKPLNRGKIPPPNAYCEKKFMYPKRTTPAPSFGIRHSPFLGKQQEYLKPSVLKIAISGED